MVWCPPYPRLDASSIRKLLLRLLQQTIDELGVFVCDLLHLYAKRKRRGWAVAQRRSEQTMHAFRERRGRKPEPYLVYTLCFRQSLHTSCTCTSDVVLSLLGVGGELLKEGSSVGRGWSETGRRASGCQKTKHHLALHQAFATPVHISPDKLTWGY